MEINRSIWVFNWLSLVNSVKMKTYYISGYKSVSLYTISEEQEGDHE